MSKKILGIITARGGSKRVPRKNVKNFHGKPLFAWSIEVGKKSGAFDRFILSTEDNEIREIGKRWDIEVPFMRPANLAGDTATSYEVVKHAVEWLQSHQNYEPDWIILLEPSSPGRQSFHIKEVVELINTRKGIDSIVGISEAPAHFSPHKALVMDKKEIVTRVGDGAILRELVHRNQDVPKTYFINSAIYAFKTSNLFDGRDSLWGNSTLGYVMDSKYALDVDTPEDWEWAEYRMDKLLKER